jgi:hypothetical protein
MDRGQLVQFVEGILQGIIKEGNFTEIGECMQFSEGMEQLIAEAVTDFEKETFEGVRDGLKDIAQAVKMIPTLLQDCHLAEEDMQRLIAEAEVFEYPF